MRTRTLQCVAFAIVFFTTALLVGAFVAEVLK